MAASNPEDSAGFTFTVSSSSTDHITYYPSQTTWVPDTFTSGSIWITPQTVTVPTDWSKIQIIPTEWIPQSEVWIQDGIYHLGKIENIEVKKAKKNLLTLLTPLQRQRQMGQRRAKGQNCEFLFVEEMGV